VKLRIISPFGQLELWASSSGVRDVFASIAYVFTSSRSGGSVRMMMIISPFGQLGVWAPSSGARDVFTSMESLVDDD